MISVFLPIADIVVPIETIFLIGFIGSFLSSSLGISGGIIINSGLMGIGVPSEIAISTQLNNSVGTSFCGFLNYQRQKDVDIAFSIYLLIGGLIGAALERLILSKISYINGNYAILKILAFVVILIGSFTTLFYSFKTQKVYEKGVLMKGWMIYLPFHKIFLRARVEISILIPLVVGFLTGMLTTSLGGGGNILINPILTYLLARNSPVVKGTSMLSGFLLNTFITLISSIVFAPIDFVLLIVLSVSGAIGAIAGIRIVNFLSKKIIGVFASIMMFLLAIRMYLELKTTNFKKIIVQKNFNESFNQICNKLQNNPKQEWMLKIVIYANDNPLFYSIILLLGIIVLSLIMQFLYNAVFKK